MTHSEAEKFQALFEDIHNQLYRLDTNWRIYSALYRDPPTVNLLCRVALITFGAIQHVFREAIILGIERLIEPGSSRGRRRASLETLVLHLPPHAASSVRRTVKKQLNSLQNDCRVVSDWRDRTVGHRDYDTAVEENPQPLEEIELRIIRRAIAGSATIVSAISDECGLNLRYDSQDDIGELDVDELIRRLTVTEGP